MAGFGEGEDPAVDGYGSADGVFVAYLCFEPAGGVVFCGELGEEVDEFIFFGFGGVGFAVGGADVF